MIHPPNPTNYSPPPYCIMLTLYNKEQLKSLAPNPKPPYNSPRYWTALLAELNPITSLLPETPLRLLARTDASGFFVFRDIEMNELKLSNKKLAMSSLEIAELTGKRHNDVLRDVRKMVKALYGTNKILGILDYANMRNEEIQGVTVIFDDRGFMSNVWLDQPHMFTILTKYSYVLRKRIIDRWLELERISRTSTLDLIHELSMIPSQGIFEINCQTTLNFFTLQGKDRHDELTKLEDSLDILISRTTECGMIMPKERILEVVVTHLVNTPQGQYWKLQESDKKWVDFHLNKSNRTYEGYYIKQTKEMNLAIYGPRRELEAVIAQRRRIEREQNLQLN